MGACSKLDAWVSKHKDEGRQVNPKRYDEIYARLGSAIPMPNIPRNCEFFEGKI